MSVERNRSEAMRWMKQARSDSAAARDSARNGHCEWACFQAQQAAEKAMKACWYQLDLDPWGHSVAKLVDDLPRDIVGEAFLSVRDSARQLDKLYVPTRYPNGLPEMTPAEAYSESDAQSALAAAESILALVQRYIDAH